MMTKRIAMWACFIGFMGLSGCQKPKAPNTENEEDKLLFAWGQSLLAGDKVEALKLYDLELRQKLEFWDRTLKPVNNPTTQASLLAQALPRLGEPVALQTVGDEAWAELKDAPWTQEVADGKCITGRPGKEDVGRGIMPKERKEMPQELGLWVFELRTAVPVHYEFRVNCPKSGSFWVQLAKRKGGDSLKIIRVTK